jgi:hypothetical protein
LTIGGSLGPTGSGVITANAIAASTSGANLTNLIASNLASCTVPTARLGSGTANSTTYLRGDGTWQAPFGVSGTLTITSGGNVTNARCSDLATTGDGSVLAGDYLILKTPSATGLSITVATVANGAVTLRVCNHRGANYNPDGDTISFLAIRP